MKLIKQSILAIVGAIMFTSCHSSSYLKKFHKEAKKESGTAKVKLRRDTVRVIYPELAMFDFNKDEVKAEAKTSLERFAEILKRYDRINMIINGYTDTVGTTEVNKDLSMRRANNAKTLFESSGISSSRIQTNGMGADNPVMTNTTQEGRQANRRIEVLLYEKK